MSYSTVSPSAQNPYRRPADQAWTVRKSKMPRADVAMPKARVTRRFETEWLEDGQVQSHTCLLYTSDAADE